MVVKENYSAYQKEEHYVIHMLEHYICKPELRFTLLIIYVVDIYVNPIL